MVIATALALVSVAGFAERYRDGTRRLLAHFALVWRDGSAGPRIAARSHALFEGEMRHHVLVAVVGGDVFNVWLLQYLHGGAKRARHFLPTVLSRGIVIQATFRNVVCETLLAERVEAGHRLGLVEQLIADAASQFLLEVFQFSYQRPTHCASPIPLPVIRLSQLSISSERPANLDPDGKWCDC